MNICQKERIFFFTHAITILSLVTYSVCDEKVKIRVAEMLTWLLHLMNAIVNGYPPVC